MSIFKINNYVLLALSLFVPFIGTFKGIPNQFIFKQLFLELVVYYFVFSIVAKRKLVTRRVGGITVALLLFFTAEFFSGLFSTDIDLANQRVYQDFQFVVIFIIINNLITDDDSYSYIFKGLLAGFLLSCMIGYLQYKHVERFYLFSDQELNANTGIIGIQKGFKTAVVRIWGPFGNALSFSEYLSVVGVALYSYYRFFKKINWIAFIMLAFAALLIFLTAARAAIVALVVPIFIIEILYSRRNRYKGIFFLAAILAIFILVFIFFVPALDGISLFSRFLNAGDDFKEGRLNLWIKGFHAFSKNVFFGVGPGNLFLALSAEGYPMTSELISAFNGQHVENYFLTELYTVGIIGFFFCVRLHFLLVKYSLKLFNQYRSNVPAVTYGGLMLAPAISLIINSITDPALIFEEKIQLLFAFMLAITSCSYFTFYKDKSSPRVLILAGFFSGKSKSKLKL